MISIIEPICIKWEHEEVNAGLLKLVSDVSGNDKFVFYAEKEQIKSVMSIYSADNIRFIEIEESSRRKSRESRVLVNNYISLLLKVIKDSNPDVILITTAYKPCIIAVHIISHIYSRVKFWLTLHGMIETKWGETNNYINIMKRGRNNSRIGYITYSPFCEKLLIENNISKVLFLNHPYIAVRKKRSVIRGDKLKIGIVGACANGNAARLISAIACNPLISDKCTFEVLSNNSQRLRGLKNVNIISSEFSRSQKESLMQNIDFLLIPYGANDYQLSATGVIWDAVSNKVPCLMYDSRYLQYYQQKIKMGYQTHSLEKLIKKIQHIVDADCEIECFIGLKELYDDNIKKIMYMFREE